MKLCHKFPKGSEKAEFYFFFFYKFSCFISTLCDMFMIILERLFLKTGSGIVQVCFFTVFLWKLEFIFLYNA